MRLRKKQRKVVPEYGLDLIHHFIDVLIQPRIHLGHHLLDNTLGLEFGVHGVEVAKLLQGSIDTDVGHLFGLAGNHTLPAKRAHPDKLNGIERHLDGEPVGKPADNGRHQWHR